MPGQRSSVPSRRVRLSALTAVAGASLLLAACTATPEPVVTATPVPQPTASGDGILRIGTLFSTTGDLAATGAAQTAGVNAAVREINAAGGIGGAPIEVVNRNGGDGTGDAATTAFTQLVEAEVDAVIGAADATVLEQVAGLAAEAGIPLLTSAALPAEATDPAWVFGTVPDVSGAAGAVSALAEQKGAASLAIVSSETGTADAGAATLVDALARAESGPDVAATAVAEDGLSAAAVSDARDDLASADGVVLVAAQGESAEDIAAAVGEVTSAGIGAAAVWLVSSDAVDFAGLDRPAVVEGLVGLSAGTTADTEFGARLQREDPSLTDFHLGAEAYDATVLVALAATLAEDDAGASVRWALSASSSGGIPCASFGECLDVLESEDDVAYAGASGALEVGETGAVRGGTFSLAEYGADGRGAFVELLAAR